MSSKYVDGQFDNVSFDSQFAGEELRFLDACIDCDDDSLYEIIQNGITWEEVNERDKSGRTGLSHACANGFIPILELLVKLEDVDPNLPDNDGNSPLIFAAQAGHDEVVNFLLRHFRQIKIDQSNNLGFTALMKAAIQGRTKSAKLLLFAGANPNRRDSGRRLCAEEWARFCGRHSCADSIAKYIRSKKYFFTKTFLLSKEKWSSEPDLLAKPSKVDGGGGFGRSGGSAAVAAAVSAAAAATASAAAAAATGTASRSASGRSGRRDSLGWIQRHLSMKRRRPGGHGATVSEKRQSLSLQLELQVAAIAGSAPMLVRAGSPFAEPSSPASPSSSGEGAVGGGGGTGSFKCMETALSACSSSSSSRATAEEESRASINRYRRCIAVLPKIRVTAGDSVTSDDIPQTPPSSVHQQQPLAEGFATAAVSPAMPDADDADDDDAELAGCSAVAAVADGGTDSSSKAPAFIPGSSSSSSSSSSSTDVQPNATTDVTKEEFI